MFNTVSFRLTDLWQQITADPLAMLPWLHMVILSLAMPGVVALVLLVIGRWAMGSWRWAFMLMICGTTLLFGMAGYWPPHVPPLPDNGTSFRIAHINALVYNHTYQPKVTFVQQANAQLVSVVESQPDLLEQLEAHTTKLPYKGMVGGGTLLLSAWPIKQLERFTDKAALYKVSPPDAKPFYVLQIHPIAPSTPVRLVQRNALWKQITEATLPQPLIVMGDANTVPWDPLLTTFAQKNLIQPHGWLPSFPSLLPLTPIDLLLTPPHWKTTLRRVYVPETDHLGWVADITL